MRKDVNRIKKRLQSFDKHYDKDPEVPKQIETYRRKYSSLTEEDLLKQFTI
jgi:hypothetical protein